MFRAFQVEKLGWFDSLSPVGRAAVVVLWKRQALGQLIRLVLALMVFGRKLARQSQRVLVRLAGVVGVAQLLVVVFNRVCEIVILVGMSDLFIRGIRGGQY